MIASAVRSSFGWGWAEVVEQAEAPPAEPVERQAPGRGRAGPAPRAAPKPAPKPVAIDSAETAVLGLELYWAGRVLGEPKYEAAAFEAARGVASLQARTGQIRARGLLGGAGAARPEASDVPDRAPTRAALALLLTLIDADREPGGGGAGPRPPAANDGAEGRRWAERLKGAAQHAAFWLAGQQTPAGAWPTSYPPDAPFGKGYKVIRLDWSDYRDNLCTLLLAGEVLDDANLRRLAGRAVDGLLALRIANWKTGARGLWASANTLDGEPPRKFPELNRGYDLLASRYAMQALLAAYLLTLEAKDDEALSDATRALAALPKQQDKWVRFYTWRGDLASVLPTSQPGGPFQPDRPAIDDGSAGAFGLGPTLDALAQINAVGGKKYADFLAAERPINARLAEQVCGLSDDALGMRLVRRSAGADASARAGGGGGGGAAGGGTPPAGAGPEASDPRGDVAPAEAPALPGADAPGLSDRTLRLWQLLQKTMAKTERP